MSTEKYITSNCLISNHTVYKDEKPLFNNKDADLQGFLLSGYHHFNVQYPRYHRMDNLSKLGMLACEVLLHNGFREQNYRPENVGVVLANSSSSLDTDLRFYESVKEIASPALFVYTLPNIMIGEICIRNNFKGENAFFIFDKFDAAFIVEYVSNLFDSNVLQACVCGWVELFAADYKAVLFLIEKKSHGQPVYFTMETINKIYQLENG